MTHDPTPDTRASLPTYEDVVAFHGHSCPGLAMGYRMTRAAMAELQDTRAEDEELVAVVENDACGVDALQWLTGCTFGKGNLQFRDYGKRVYSLFSRRTGMGVRVLFHGSGIPAELREDRTALSDYILSAPQEELLTVAAIQAPPPAPATIRASVACERCGEQVMETRLREVEGRRLCIPCAS